MQSAIPLRRKQPAGMKQAMTNKLLHATAGVLTDDEFAKSTK
jgi:hypothetical protein